MVMVAVMMVSTGEVVAEGEGVKCFEGEVTYCGINADGGAIPAKGKKYYAEGMNWACSDQLSNLDPTNIAPNCWDQASCEALQTLALLACNQARAAATAVGAPSRSRARRRGAAASA